MSNTLLQTKLYRPPVQRFLETRPRLVEKLEAGLDGRLTLVSAPAGFGKTTLVAGWAASLPRSRTAELNPKSEPRTERSRSIRDPKFCWLSLDENDNDLTRFLTYFVAAIQSLGEPWTMSSLDQDLIAHYTSARPPDVETLLMILINEITAVPDRFILVLDEYQVITLTAVHDALAYLLDHMPPNMHLIICTRVDPPLPLARLRARGQMAEIRQRDLRFTEEEAAQFLQQAAGDEITAGETAALARRTEGWPAGLQMAAVSLGASDDAVGFVRDFTGSNRHILDYLLGEVLEGQPQDIRDFLLHTAVLDRMTAPLCDAVCFGETERSGGTHILEQLERSNLFVLPLDNERSWYRYHRLFADLLRLTLRSEMPERIPLLHRRASRWFEENSFAVEAIDHALAAEDFERAARLLDDFAGQFLLRGEIALLLHRLDALPDDVITDWPSLCIYHAWTRLLAGRSPVEVQARLRDAEEAGDITAVALIFKSLLALLAADASHSLRLSDQALEALPDFGGPPSASSGQAPSAGIGIVENAYWRSRVYSNRGMAYVMSGDMEAAIDAFEESARIGQEAGDKMAVVGSLSNLAGLTLARGQLHKSQASYRRALDLATDAQGRRLPVAHRVLLGLGELAREWNDLSAAEGYFAESLELSQRYGEIGPMNLMGLMSLLHLARVKAAQGEIETADAMFTEARQMALISEVTPLDDFLVGLAHARHALEQGDLAAAERWAIVVRSPESEVQGPYEIYEVEQLLLARLDIARGKADEALAKLVPLQATAEQRGQNRRLIEILNLKALALYAQGDDTGALETINQALHLAQPEGYIRIFVDAGKPMARLLKKAYLKGIAPDYVRRLLAAFDPSGAEQLAPAQTHSTLIEPLSDRELEVLQQLAEGLSNREIAARLVISLSTVKGHTANIYSKLGVHRRTSAVARARELGLLT